MNLCIDVGNTRIKVAVFDQEGYVLYTGFTLKLELDYYISLIEKYNCQYGILSSVVSTHASLRNLLSMHLKKILFVDHSLALPICNECKGGSILPGINMRFQSMSSFTKKLPLVKADKLFDFIGNTTATCMQTGVMYGVMHEINGFYALYKQNFNDVKLLITGGDADYFDHPLVKNIVIIQNLALIGLNKILSYNIGAY